MTRMDYLIMLMAIAVLMATGGVILWTDRELKRRRHSQRIPAELTEDRPEVATCEFWLACPFDSCGHEELPVPVSLHVDVDNNTVWTEADTEALWNHWYREHIDEQT